MVASVVKTQLQAFRELLKKTCKSVNMLKCYCSKTVVKQCVEIIYVYIEEYVLTAANHMATRDKNWCLEYFIELRNFFKTFMLLRLKKLNSYGGLLAHTVV